MIVAAAGRRSYHGTVSSTEPPPGCEPATGPSHEDEFGAAAWLLRCRARYRRRVTTLLLVLLSGWAAVGLGCGALLADWLNQFHVGGFPLGFWFAQQGAVLGFVLLVLANAVGMAWLERRYRRELHAGRDRR